MVCMLAQLGFVPFLDELVRSAAVASASASKADVGERVGNVERERERERERGREHVLDFGHIECPVPYITRWTGARLDVEFEFSGE